MLDVTFEAGHLIGGRYRVVRRLGAGGMGAVYEAEHLELGRMVAVKVLLPQFGSNRDMSSRFMREARSAAQIGHPGIVQVFDLGVDSGLPFLVMEKLDGEELSDRIARDHPLPVTWVTNMAVELCDALQAAHDHGIIHRDLKPPNVFLARQGRRSDVVKVLDFGIAKLLHGADDIQTRTGQVFGTPMYMAPEQLRDSKDVDGRVDVYAIACLVFQTLTGKPPFEGTTYPDLVLRICAGPRPDVAQLRSDVPAAIAELLARALAVNPAERPTSPAEFARALGAPDAALAPAVGARSGEQAFITAPTELATSASALTPHSRTAPPIPVTRSWLPLVITGAALAVGGAAFVALRAPSANDPRGVASNGSPNVSAAPPPLPPAAPPGPGPLVVPVPPPVIPSATPPSLPAPSALPPAASAVKPVTHPAGHGAGTVHHTEPAPPVTGAPPPIVPP